jgi:5-methylcytosine-specific restriction protein B
MNTSDRSIAMIDAALRRRFSFVEMKPDSGLLKNVVVEGIEMAEVLDTINRRITVLLDREHTIGHACFLPLRGNATIEKLADVFKSQVIPLLQEYFFDDYEKIQLVLGDNQKSDDCFRFVSKKAGAVKLFGDASLDFPDFYEINETAFMRIEAYAFLA